VIPGGAPVFTPLLPIAKIHPEETATHLKESEVYALKIDGEPN
jgi:hypothetical protein